MSEGKCKECGEIFKLKRQTKHSNKIIQSICSKCSTQKQNIKFNEDISETQ